MQYLVNRGSFPGMKNTSAEMHDDGTYLYEDMDEGGLHLVRNLCFREPEGFPSMYSDPEDFCLACAKKLSDGNVPVYGSGGIMRYADQYLYDKESVLIPRKGTLNNVIYVNEPFWSVDTMFYTEMKCENIAKYVYRFLSEKNLESLNAGSAVPSMTTDILNAMPILIPDSKSLASFEAFATPIYTKIAENNKENKKLAMLRDALLPKLMSGEIDVA
jgi:type I restriction enzyme S subunit